MPLTAQAFQLLLERLDPNEAVAADKYGVLQMKLTKVFVWKGCPEFSAEELADTVLDRIASKLEKGEEIENLNAFASEVARYVWLERGRSKDAVTDGGELPELPVKPIETLDEDPRRNCLLICLNEKIPDPKSRQMFLSYYDPDPGKKNKDHRRALSEKYGITPGALKKRMCLLRQVMEKCINECVDRVTKRVRIDTHERGGAS